MAKANDVLVATVGELTAENAEQRALLNIGLDLQWPAWTGVTVEWLKEMDSWLASEFRTDADAKVKC